jgi:hypothetical protein
LVDQGLSTDVIAAKIGKTHDAVKQKIVRLNLEVVGLKPYDPTTSLKISEDFPRVEEALKIAEVL